MGQIIGLLGSSGAGKSEIAKHLVEEHGYVRLRFADGLKNMLKTLGLTEAQVDGSEKNVPIPLLGGRTYREAATSLGTGWGRDMMDPDLWVRALEQHMLSILLAGDANIVIDDVRYPNEVRLLERYGAVLVTIRRPATEPRLNWWQRWAIAVGFPTLSGLHSSETYYRMYAAPFTLINDGPLSELLAGIGTLLPKVPRHAYAAY